MGHLYHGYVESTTSLTLKLTTRDSGAILQAVLPSVLGTFPGAEKVPFFSKLIS